MKLYRQAQLYCTSNVRYGEAQRAEVLNSDTLRRKVAGCSCFPSARHCTISLAESKGNSNSTMQICAV